MNRKDELENINKESEELKNNIKDSKKDFLRSTNKVALKLQQIIFLN